MHPDLFLSLYTFRYNQSASTTVSDFTNATSVAIFNSTARAHVVKENCSLTTTNGSQWYYPNQTSKLLSHASSLRSDTYYSLVVVTGDLASRYQDTSGFTVGQGLNGLIGIGTNRNLASRSSNNSAYSGNFEDSIMGQWLRANPQADNFTFGMALSSPVVQATLRGDSSSNSTASENSAADTPAGVLHMLQPDHSAYVADSVAWATVDNSLNPQDDPQDWTVPLDGWTLIAGTNQVNSRKQMVANIDPLYTGMYLPLDQATLIRMFYFCPQKTFK